MTQLILAILVGSLVSLAAQVNTSVQYVSTTAVYLDAGRTAGIAQGDTVVISRSGTELIRLVVGFVADNSSSCELANAPSVVAKGDQTVVFIKEAVRSETPVSQDSPEIVSVQELRRELILPVDRTNQLSGRIGVGYAMQDDREIANYDYSEPSFSMRATLSRISGSDFSARVNLKLRRTIRANDDLTSSSNRIYEALLSYEPQDKPISAGMGRLLLRETRGMGYLDGAYAKYAASENWKLGAIGGVEPDLQNTRIQSDVTKIGAFASFERRLGVSNSLQATASLAGRYLEGEISREFVYQQLSFMHGSKLRLFESTEINLNRGWLKDAEGSSLTIASLLLDARYNFSRALGVAVGYDNRTNYYTAETRSIPDSVFASSLQSGFRASVDTRFGSSYLAELGLAGRDGETDFSQSSSGWARLGTSNLLESQVSAFARLRWFDSDYSKGQQPSVSLSRDITDWLSGGVEFGSNDYELIGSPDTISQQWLSLQFDFRFARQIYAGTEFEQGFGDGRDATYLSLVLGYRF